MDHGSWVNHPISGSNRRSNRPHWCGTDVLYRKMLPGPHGATIWQEPETHANPRLPVTPGRNRISAGSNSTRLPIPRTACAASSPCWPAICPAAMRLKRSGKLSPRPCLGRIKGGPGEMEARSSRAGTGCAGALPAARPPLTPPIPSGIIIATGWPGGAANAPGRGATCGGR